MIVTALQVSGTIAFHNFGDKSRGRDSHLVVLVNVRTRHS
jgi:hypothetical protein